MRGLRWWMTNFALIGTSLAWLINFILLEAYGEMLVVEPNQVILCLESILVSGLIIFAIINLIDIIRR